MAKENEKKTILIVDDALTIHEILHLVLDEKGYKIIKAMDGEEGLNKYKEYKPDLILLDMVMPNSKIDGLNLLGQIREKDSSTLIIVITGYSDMKEEAFRLGADDFIEKPFDTNFLCSVVEKSFHRNAMEAKIHRLNRFNSILSKENKKLGEEIQKFARKQEKNIHRKEIDKYKDICGSVAHGLKNEFMHIGNATEYIRDLPNNSSEILEECSMIERSVVYSQLLLRRLLDYLDMGIPQVEPIKVSELLKKMEIMVLPRLSSNIKLNIIISDDANKLKISANPEQLMEVLIEFIQNASNAMRNKGGIININAKKDDSHIIISVIDNGPGIPKELKEKLLKDQVPSKKGLGLGLFLSNRVIGMLGGNMNLESSSDEGTAITISLPIANEKGGE
jgi:signal transduction histidine kinase